MVFEFFKWCFSLNLFARVFIRKKMRMNEENNRRRHRRCRFYNLICCFFIFITRVICFPRSALQFRVFYHPLGHLHPPPSSSSFPRPSARPPSLPPSLPPAFHFSPPPLWFQLWFSQWLELENGLERQRWNSTCCRFVFNRPSWRMSCVDLSFMPVRNWSRNVSDLFLVLKQERNQWIWQRCR